MRPIVLAVALMCANCIAANAQDDDEDRSRGRPDSALVQYVVEGTIIKASVTYLNNRGEMRQEEIKIPWSASFPMGHRTPVYIRAQKLGSQGGDITVRILVDGVVQK